MEIEQKADNTVTITYDLIKEAVKKATANPVKMEFPQDKWGFTSQIKKEVLKAAGTVRGQQDKHDLLVATLAMLLQHIKLRLEPDRALQQERIKRLDDAAAERASRERIGATPTAPKE